MWLDIRDAAGAADWRAATGKAFPHDWQKAWPSPTLTPHRSQNMADSPIEHINSTTDQEDKFRESLENSARRTTVLATG
jgi:hypothetical protein